ncbi:OLC1v1027847C1 [Oldenlandia corymbosa var. corymbosa]|uniref:OLC1v1027847C1 n=1 Tax=Oldenlandia corymbosa var. corymbosa TaxID=529605 RepID=A0AAV1CAD3_OLDCO|nr:OLC1v1027847C1 [Oldenlandia corymbosa var. corymbosa]
MAFSKTSFLLHLKTITTNSRLYSRHFHQKSPSMLISLRPLSFATPEEAAAERRKQRRRNRIEPPLSALRPHQQAPPQPPRPSSPASANQNPNAPKLPEPVSVLSGNRLNLHNKILKLIRENDLEEAALYTRHSVYSNCRPTMYTCNAVMAALYRQAKYADLLSLHRFITQAGIPTNIITYNLLFSTYMDCRRADTAMEYYKQLINDAPFSPSPTTYRILVKGLVDNQKLERAMELKDEMLSKGLDPDPTVYGYLMSAHAKNANPDGVFDLYEELKEKMGGSVSDGVIYGSLMKGYFLRGMDKEAMECYEDAVGEKSEIKMTAMAFNYVLDALNKNGKFVEALKLFTRMLNEHDPPKRLTVNLGSYNVMVDGYCVEGRFKDAIDVFNSMGEKRCRPDTLSYNNLIEHLCKNGMLTEAEELYNGMKEKGVNPDEYTFVTLMDTCFEMSRSDDAAAYYKTMIESKLRPSLAIYNKLVEGLVKVGKVDDAKSFFDMMVSKLRMDDESYKFMMNALFEVGKHNDVIETIGRMLREDPGDFTPELEEFVREALRKEGREEELTKLIEDVEREKAEAAAAAAEAAEKAKASARAAVSSLIPSKLFGNKDSNVESAAAGENFPGLMGAGQVNDAEAQSSQEGTNLGATDAKSDGSEEQAAA